mmetsp:Transcript_8095/g.22604  ORF Transcript_8095/g.22604 Transcript_8095/m.22604 type:complete len:108 (-) Transcript_8095:45-368(-)
MLKDVSTAVDSVCRSTNDDDQSRPPQPFPIVKDVLGRAVDLESKSADYTKVIRPLEAAAGLELHTSSKPVVSDTTLPATAYAMEKYHAPPIQSCTLMYTMCRHPTSK